MNPYYHISGKCPNCEESALMSDGVDCVYCAKCGNEEFTDEDFHEKDHDEQACLDPFCPINP